jgi:hypothetical protein
MRAPSAPPLPRINRRGKDKDENSYVAKDFFSCCDIVLRLGRFRFKSASPGNLDQRAPIAQTLDADSNLRAQDRMKKLASELRLIVPGHDPAIFTRFPKPGGGVAKIE